MRIPACLMVLMVLFFPVAVLGEAVDSGIRITILYDNTSHAEGTTADWGFSALVEGPEKTVLFDTGTKPEIFSENVKKLGIDLSSVDLVVISHNHGDHTGGLDYILQKHPGVQVYLPDSFPAAFFSKVESAGAKVIRVSGPVQIGKGIYSTGDLPGPVHEQSLIFDTGASAVLMTGCAHPGIVNIVEKASEILGKKISFVFGGFHLMEATRAEIEEVIKGLDKAGVDRCGATHCTGEQQITWFRERYGDRFVPLGVGRIVIF